MAITEVSIKLATGTGAPNNLIRAYCSLVIDDWLKIDNVRIIRRKDGSYLVAMPHAERAGPSPVPSGKTMYYTNDAGERRLYHYRDVIHPISCKGREYLHRKVMEAYERTLDSGESWMIVGMPDETEAVERTDDYRNSTRKDFAECVAQPASDNCPTIQNSGVRVVAPTSRTTPTISVGLP